MKSLTMCRPLEGVRLFGGIDKLMDSFFGMPQINGYFNPEGRFPQVDVREENGAYVFEASLPGFDREDIEVNLDGRTLTIESKKEIEEKAYPSGNYIIRERNHESFSRSFKLPDNVDAGGVEAGFNNGVLTLTIKKHEEAQKKVIEIK